LPAGDIEYVRVEETENNFFQCYGAGDDSWLEMRQVSE
jgi:hypothetical protein